MAQSGGSRVGFRAAMRARDVSRPRPEDERAAEQEAEAGGRAERRREPRDQPARPRRERRD